MSAAQGMVTEKGLQETMTKRAIALDAAKLALGLELLRYGPNIPTLRAACTMARQELDDTESMVLAFYQYKLQQEQAVFQLHPKRARVPEAEYLAAKKRFKADYSSLRRTPGAVYKRGAVLRDLAKRCGQRALSDVQEYFDGLRASPELHSK